MQYLLFIGTAPDTPVMEPDAETPADAMQATVDWVDEMEERGIRKFGDRLRPTPSWRRAVAPSTFARPSPRPTRISGGASSPRSSASPAIGASPRTARRTHSSRLSSAGRRMEFRPIRAAGSPSWRRIA